MSFHNDIPIKAVRKTHVCGSCGTTIQIGEPAVRWNCRLDDGTPTTSTMHPDCRKAEIELNRLHRTMEDEWMALTDMEWEDHPWLLESHPAIAARMGITAEESAATHKEMAECGAFWSRIDRERRAQAETERLARNAAHQAARSGAASDGSAA